MVLIHLPINVPGTQISPLLISQMGLLIVLISGEIAAC